MDEFTIPVEVLIYAQLPKMLRGEEVDITPIVSLKINEVILDALKKSIKVPTEFEGLIDVMLMAEQMKAVTAVLRGEEYTPAIDKIIELMVNFSLIESLTSAFGGT